MTQSKKSRGDAKYFHICHAVIFGTWWEFRRIPVFFKFTRSHFRNEIVQTKSNLLEMNFSCVYIEFFTHRVVCKQNDVRTRQTEHFNLLDRQIYFRIDFSNCTWGRMIENFLFYREKRGEGRSNGKSIKSFWRRKSSPKLLRVHFSFVVCMHVTLNKVLLINSQEKNRKSMALSCPWKCSRNVHFAKRRDRARRIF